MKNTTGRRAKMRCGVQEIRSAVPITAADDHTEPGSRLASPPAAMILGVLRSVVRSLLDLLVHCRRTGLFWFDARTLWPRLSPGGVQCRGAYRRRRWSWLLGCFATGWRRTNADTELLHPLRAGRRGRVRRRPAWRPRRHVKSAARCSRGCLSCRNGRFLWMPGVACT